MWILNIFCPKIFLIIQTANSNKIRPISMILLSFKTQYGRCTPYSVKGLLQFGHRIRRTVTYSNQARNKRSNAHHFT